MTGKPLTDLEKELLADLYEVEEMFKSGRLRGGTLSSHVLYRMASRRGRTLPAPVHGKVQTDSGFSGVYARGVNRLISQGLVRKRSINDGFEGLPYQWGFANHGKKDKDIFLTEAGRELGRALSEEREKRVAAATPPPPIATPPELVHQEPPPPRPAAAAEASPPDGAQPPAQPPAQPIAQGPGPHMPGATIDVQIGQPVPVPGAPGHVYALVPNMMPVNLVMASHNVDMGSHTITYVYTKKIHPPKF
jgi:hypothetical protein